MATTLMPKFELAFRRTLFFLFLISGYLVFGATVLRILPSHREHALSREREEKLDFERAELLNVLWAESMARSEQEWALLANHKLDAYERTRASAYARFGDDEHEPLDSFSEAFHHAFLLITTIGGIDTDNLSYEQKLFSLVYSIVGIPLMMLYLGQCAKAIRSLFPGRQIFSLVLILIFASAIIYDIIEQEDEDVPFLDAILAVFLAMTTIGEEDSEIPAIFLYVQSLIGLSAFSVACVVLQHEIEKYFQFYEIAFTHKVAEVERRIVGDGVDQVDRSRIDSIREEEEEEIDITEYSEM